jgi:hypothetical protein
MDVNLLVTSSLLVDVTVGICVAVAMEGSKSSVEPLSFALFVPVLTTLNEVCIFIWKKTLRGSGGLSWAIALTGLVLTTATVVASIRLLSGLDYNTKVTGSLGIVLQALVHTMGQLRLLDIDNRRTEDWRSSALAEAAIIDDVAGPSERKTAYNSLTTARMSSLLSPPPGGNTRNDCFPFVPPWQ